MGLFFNHQRSVRKSEQLDSNSELEVAKVKRGTHTAADRANKSITEVNKRLISNGITLNISVAVGAHHARHR